MSGARGVRVGVVGASGYTGAELLRLCAGHPELEVEVATGDTQAGIAIGELYPSLAAAYRGLAFEPFDPSLVEGLDLVFLALPHGQSQSIVPELREKVKHIVDLAADFRLRDPALYPAWYGEPHGCPELLGEFVYGLPELHRSEISGAAAVAAPGCYPTAAALALAPLVRGGLVELEGIIVDAASGVSGAGRSVKEATAFCTVDENFTAYGLLDHRHTPEMEQVLGARVLFTPHLAPMSRGILATCYARAAAEVTTEQLLEALRDFYQGEPFAVVTEGSPSTKATAGSNAFHLSAHADTRTGWVVALCALDNLVKGASGQAIQCANLMFGLAESTGLVGIGVYP